MAEPREEETSSETQLEAIAGEVTSRSRWQAALGGVPDSPCPWRRIERGAETWFTLAEGAQGHRGCGCSLSLAGHARSDCRICFAFTPRTYQSQLTNELGSPFAVATDSANNAWISDYPGGVYKFNSAGERLTEHISGANFAGEANRLYSVAVDQSDDDLYAADTLGDAIDRFASSGALLNRLSPFEDGDISVAVDNSGGPSDGRVYVAQSSTGNGRGRNGRSNRWIRPTTLSTSPAPQATSAATSCSVHPPVPPATPTSASRRASRSTQAATSLSSTPATVNSVLKKAVTSSTSSPPPASSCGKSPDPRANRSAT